MRTRNRHPPPSAPKGLMVVADKPVILSSAPSSRRALCYQGHRASLRGVSRAAGRLLVVLLAPYDIKGVVGTASWRRKWRVPRRGGGGHRPSRRCTVVGLAADTKRGHVTRRTASAQRTRADAFISVIRHLPPQRGTVRPHFRFRHVASGTGPERPTCESGCRVYIGGARGRVILRRPPAFL
jgi:hypothetical protein